MFFDYHISMDSFGQTCPENWEEIADFLNGIIDSMEGITDNETGEFTPEGRDQIDNLWERYCAGEIDGAPRPILD